MYFLKLYAEKNQKDIEGFSEDAMHALSSYDWPGNVRELENAVERAVVFTNTKTVPLSVLPQIVPALREAPHTLTFKIGMPWHELEGHAIELALAHTRGNKPLAARLLGIATRTIYRHLNQKERHQEPERDAAVEVKDRKTIAETKSPKLDPPQDPEVKKWKAQSV
jgi:two-component system response regulator HydG